MVKIFIRSPIWKTQSVGIADRKIVDDIEVVITYLTIDGDRLYPGLYFMKRDKARSYPCQIWRGVRLRIIPIADFELRRIRRRRDKRVEDICLI